MTTSRIEHRAQTQPQRLDQALVARGLARSRTRAQQMVASGRVLVNGIAVTKAAAPVHGHDRLTVDRPQDEWVGRGSGKLLAALDAFPVSVGGRWALDAGASTGGFTQVLLRAGAAHVDAVDVGHGQLDAQLRADPRVNCVEGVNLRDFTLDDLGRSTGPRPDLVVGDLSFISLELVIPALVEELHPADMILLIKPQFEVGRDRLGAGGVVTDPDLQRQAIRAVLSRARACGYAVEGLIPSPVVGTHGNQEFPVWLRPGRSELERVLFLVDGVVRGRG
jgi:23S rRNA (cytidine1920-2'-O)/16S rRNA (cytidine1409-2'-O)-methyltransferase